MFKVGAVVRIVIGVSVQVGGNLVLKVTTVMCAMVLTMISTLILSLIWKISCMALMRKVSSEQCYDLL